jgi:hydroxymethylpyrimidine pyrophosphatase-like HAD family hydrolase
MSRRLLCNWPVNQLLSKDWASDQVKSIIKELTHNQLLAIIEISINILYGNIELTTEQRTLIQPYTRVLNYLSEESHTLKQKQKYLARNILAIKEIVLASDSHITSLQTQQHEQSGETSPSTLGKIHTTDTG